jgi:predicted metal-dependent hydrolase
VTQTLLVPDAPGVSVLVKRSARARRMALRVARVDGRVTLTMPSDASEAEARAFVSQQAGWIARHVAATPVPRSPAAGGTVPLMGREVPIRAGTGKAARWTGEAVTLGQGGPAGPRVRTLLIGLARTRLTEAVDRHPEALGRARAGGPAPRAGI